MNACFPLIADDHSELMKELKKLCEDKYNEGIPVRARPTNLDQKKSARDESINKQNF